MIGRSQAAEPAVCLRQEQEETADRHDNARPGRALKMVTAPICPICQKTAAIIVAHPDDETLWAGGLLLTRRDLGWKVMSLCRAEDPDRAPRFYEVLKAYGASGDMADLDDGPEQSPLDMREVQVVLQNTLGGQKYDLVVTHGLRGEYTRHRRHEEVHQAVVDLWREGRISTEEVWFFAYSDRPGRGLPTAIREAHFKFQLPRTVWDEKYRIVTKVYGFRPESWEARTTPQWEAFWCFRKPAEYENWKKKELRKQ